MSPNQLIPIKNPELGGGFGLRELLVFVCPIIIKYDIG
jgi:hypothetical protein